MTPIDSLWPSRNCLQVVVEKSIFSARAALETRQKPKNKAVSIFMWSFLSNILRERHRHMEDSSGWYLHYFRFANNFSAREKGHGDVGGFKGSSSLRGQGFRDRLRT